MNSFSPGRQNISRFLARVGLSKPSRFIYDILFYSVVRLVERRQLERQALSASQVTDKEILDFGKTLQPLLTSDALERIGPESDGGYLLPRDALAIDALYSPGVASVSTLELHFAEHGVPCYLIDGSVDSPTVSHPQFNFESIFLGNKTRTGWVTLSDWIAGTQPYSTDLGLQMDIEGFEYEVLQSADHALLNRFRFLVIEFHNLEKLISREFFEGFSEILSKIQVSHFVAHVHGNNYSLPVRFNSAHIPRSIEVTFLRRKDYPAGQVSDIPHELDRPNNPNYSEIDISNFLGLRCD